MRLRNVERFKTGGAGNNIQLGIPLAKTADGRVYRYSPNENAHPRLFLLGDRVPDFALPETLTARMTHAPGTPGLFARTAAIWRRTAISHTRTTSRRRKKSSHMRFMRMPRMPYTACSMILRESFRATSFLPSRQG